MVSRSFIEKVFCLGKGKLIDPANFNANSLNELEVTHFLDSVGLILVKKRKILFQNRIEIEYPEPKLDEDTALNLECLEIFQIIYHFGYPVDHKWFMNLDKKSLKTFYLKLEDIWNYRLQLTEIQKKKIVPENDIFSAGEKHLVGTSFENTHPETLMKLRKFLLNIVRKMVSNGETKSDCINGSIYVLTALVEVSPVAANAMPEFVYVSGVNDEY